MYDRLWSESNHHIVCELEIDVPMLIRVYLVENNLDLKFRMMSDKIDRVDRKIDAHQSCDLRGQTCPT